MSEEKAGTQEREKKRSGANVGICVSGGGIRSAAFALGALQVLQQEYGLLRGANAAAYLSAVSGGSYIAGAFTLLNCSNRLKPKPKDPKEKEEILVLDPFAPGSPEVEHLRRHSRYLLDTGSFILGLRFALLIVGNVIGVLALVVGLGVAFAGLPASLLAISGTDFVDRWLNFLGGDAWYQWALWGLISVTAAAAFWHLFTLMGELGRIRRKFTRQRVKAFLDSFSRTGNQGFIHSISESIFLPQMGAAIRSFLGWFLHLRIPVLLSVYLVVYPFCMATLLTRAVTWPVTESPAWAATHAGTIACVVIGVALITGLSALVGSKIKLGAQQSQKLNRLGQFILTRVFVMLATIFIVLWSATWLFEATQDDPRFLLKVVVVLVPVLFGLSLLAGRFSPHAVYRDMITRCFSVIRVSDTEAKKPNAPRNVRLSELQPPGAGDGDDKMTDQTLFPELIVCAAANVSDVGASPSGSNVLSLTFTPSKLSIPSQDGATFNMQDVENKFTQRRALWGVDKKGPAVSLASATAMTGAAVSPSMGKMTRNNFRTLLAALNVRLGVWLPNPLSSDSRTIVNSPPADSSEENPPTDKREVQLGLTPGLPEFVAELFGSHPSGGSKVYVSDGGHYDNLGLIELLRRKCRLIWCIDASGDPPGVSRALADTILAAAGELGARVKVDLERFSTVEGRASSEPWLKHSHAVGDVTYADGTEARIVVVKLGLTEASAPELHTHRMGDRRFPHHSTANQIFRSERFDAYRALGWDSAMRASEDRKVVRALALSEDWFEDI